MGDTTRPRLPQTINRKSQMRGDFPKNENVTSTWHSSLLKGACHGSIHPFFPQKILDINVEHYKYLVILL